MPELGPPLPIALRRTAKVATLVACVWFALAAAWGMGGPLGAGHYAAMGGIGRAAENMIEWGIWGPYWEYTRQRPSPFDYYCHHPFGVFWILVPFRALFGHHEWVLRLPAIIMSGLTPCFLSGIGKRIGGWIAGSAAACAFAVLPITLGFANFGSLEVMVTFGVTLFFWGHAEWTATRKMRFLVASLIGVVFATLGDWPGYLAVGTLLALSLVRAYILPARWSPVARGVSFARWWTLSTAVTAATLLLTVGLFAQSGKLAEWLGSGAGRAGSEISLAAVLVARQHWIELMFTPLAIALGKLALPVIAVRIAVRRREEEMYSVAILLAAVIQYVAFKQGADIHIFWPHYFGTYYAIALAQLVASVDAAAMALGCRWSAIIGGRARWTAAALAIGPALLMTPDALRTLRYARESGGRYDERGWPTPSDLDAVLLLQHLHQRLPEEAIVDTHPSMQWSWHHAWAWRRTVVALSSPARIAPGPAPRVFVARANWLTAEEQKTIAANFQVDAYDYLWVVDEEAKPGPLRAFSLAAREPNWWQWCWYGGTEPVRTLVADPFATWEWRVHLGQPAEPPHGEPGTLEQVRIAHNVAVSTGDGARAAELERAIVDKLERSVVMFSHDVTLLGVRRLEGVEPRIQTWFRSSGAVSPDETWLVHSTLVEHKRFSLIPPDSKEREVSRPMWPVTSLWRPGYIYQHTSMRWHRIGVERFFGRFAIAGWGSPGMVRVDGLPDTTVLLDR